MADDDDRRPQDHDDVDRGQLMDRLLFIASRSSSQLSKLDVIDSCELDNFV